MNNLIETHNLSFSFGKQRILNGISLEVPRNSIYGFLGPNGAGKSTTIKILLGLLKVPNEKAFLFGKDIRKYRLAILSQIGNLIESPSIYGHLTAYDNLKLMRTLFPAPKSRIEEVLELVGLKYAKNKKAKHFSMGMKQRLGIGMALFHDPELIILDEPVNGLDPSGIHEMRQLFLRLQEEDKTVFISSHLLAEIEKTCTHLGILNQGKLQYQGKIEALQSSTRRRVRMKVGQIALAQRLLNSLSFPIMIEGNVISTEVTDDQHFNSLIQGLVQKKIDIYDLEREAPSLEDLFIDLTKQQ